MPFTPWRTAIGALFIQLSTTNFYLENGETIGFSSAISNLLFKPSLENVSLIIGVLASTQLIQQLYPQFISSYPQSNLLTQNIVPDISTLFGIAGFLVGIGTKLGNGCTSGHMIGGLSRLRFRSLVATAVFSISAIVTVTYFKLQFTSTTSANGKELDVVPSDLQLGLLVNAVFVYGIFPLLSSVLSLRAFLRTFHSFYSGLLFGLGLHVSGMINVTKTIGFLSILSPDSFDPSLLLIVVFTIIPNVFIWRLIKKPLLRDSFNVASSTKISGKFLLGNVLFGTGWGLLGICPGPGLINSVHHHSVLVWLGAFLAGSFTGKIVS